jgi:hypothetical protein
LVVLGWPPQEHDDNKNCAEENVPKCRVNPTEIIKVIIGFSRLSLFDLQFLPILHAILE